jgi:hypothetical protein
MKKRSQVNRKQVVGESCHAAGLEGSCCRSSPQDRQWREVSKLETKVGQELKPWTGDQTIRDEGNGEASRREAGGGIVIKGDASDMIDMVR